MKYYTYTQVFILTSERRKPRVGEWYLSGIAPNMPREFLSHHDVPGPRRILKKTGFRTSVEEDHLDAFD